MNKTNYQTIKRLSFLILFCFSIANLQAQKEDYTWVWGGLYCPSSQWPVNSKLITRFNQAIPDTIGKCGFEGGFHYTKAVISDTSGRLLMYSNGYLIYDSTGVEILYDSINHGGRRSQYGMKYPQGMLMLRCPDNDSLIYIIHEWDMGLYNPIPSNPNILKPLNSLLYSVVNMHLNHGKGAVTVKNLSLINDTLSQGCLTACRHGNGRDWWIIIPDQNTNRYYIMLLTPNGVQVMPYQEIGDGTNPISTLSYFRANGQAVFAPDGSKYIYSDNGNGVYIFDFDRCSGLLSSPIHFSVIHSNFIYTAGVAVSPNSRHLYLSQVYGDTVVGFWQGLFQFDLTAPNIQASMVTIDTMDFRNDHNPNDQNLWSWMQIAPDGKMYFTSNIGSTDVPAILDPDTRGIACRFIRSYIKMPYVYNASTALPNFPNFRLGPLDGSACDTLGLDAAIADASTYLLDFDTTQVGTYKSKTITIHNRGVKNMVIRNPFIYATGAPYTFSPAAPTVTLHGGDSIVYTVTFHPTAAIDTFYADLRLPHDGNWGLVVVGLRGVGVWPLGVTNPDGKESDYHVYPNPASDQLTVATTGAFDTESQFILTDMLGQEVLAASLPAGWNRYALNLGQVPAGVYVGRIVRNGTLVANFKVCVN